MFFVTSRRPTCPTSPKLPATVWPWIFAALAAPKIGGSLPHIHMVERTMWTTAKSASPPSRHRERGGRPRLVADHAHKEPTQHKDRTGEDLFLFTHLLVAEL